MKKVERDKYRALAVEEIAQDLRIRLIKKCPRCHGKGRIQTTLFDSDTLSFRTFPCRCAHKFRNILNFLIAGIAENTALEVIYDKKDIDDLHVGELNIQNGTFIDKPKLLYKDVLQQYVDNIDEVYVNGYSYLFIGINSTGKTFAALKVLHQFLKRGYSGHYIKFRKLMKLINKTLSGSNHERESNSGMLVEIFDTDFLIIDELGKETGNREHIASEIEELLKDRDMARKPTIVITNEKYDEIRDIYSQNLISAFSRNYRAYVFSPNKDFRVQDRKNWFEK